MSGFDGFVERWRRALPFPEEEVDRFVASHRPTLEALYAEGRAAAGAWPRSPADFRAFEELAKLVGDGPDDAGALRDLDQAQGLPRAELRALAVSLRRQGWAAIDLPTDRPLVAVLSGGVILAVVDASDRVAMAPGQEALADAIRLLIDSERQRIAAFRREVGRGVPLTRYASALWTRARAGTLGGPPLHWFELYNPEAGVPLEQSTGYRRALAAAEVIFDNVLWILDQDPIDLDILPALYTLGSTRHDLYLEDPEDDDYRAAVRPEDLPILAGTDVYGWSPEETGDLIADVLDSESREGFRSDALIKRDIARQIWLNEGRLELTSVDKETACEFIARHHSALPRCNPRGMLYAVAARVRGEVVAVATAGTPTGRWGAGGACPVDGILELTRIASIGGLTRTDRRGRAVPVSASSALASRMIDLLPVSGRRGVVGCRFVTYSLTTERATTYLSLVGKGLRPVARRRGKRPSGARGSAVSLPEADKIVWEAGPAARPPDWTLVAEERREGARKAFAHFLDRGVLRP